MRMQMELHNCIRQKYPKNATTTATTNAHRKTKKKGRDCLTTTKWMACLNECVLYPRLMVVLAVAGQEWSKKSHKHWKKKKWIYLVMLHVHSILTFEPCSIECVSNGFSFSFIMQFSWGFCYFPHVIFLFAPKIASFGRGTKTFGARKRSEKHFSLFFNANNLLWVCSLSVLVSFFFESRSDQKQLNIGSLGGCSLGM